MASLTLYVSIWTALLVVTALMMPSHYVNIWKTLESYYANPSAGVVSLLKASFSTANVALLAGIIIVGAAGLFLSKDLLTGGGFSLLFVIPLLIVFGILTMYALPTAEIMASSLPSELKMIYLAFLGGLTILTAITFMAGRP